MDPQGGPFLRALADAARASGAEGAENRRWLYVPYDQLSDRLGPLSREPARELGVVLVESRWKAARRPYHRQKLALLLANQRHFALEQARRGVAVRHVVTEGPFHAGLEPLVAELGPLRVMEPAERELRVDLSPLVERGALEVLPHEGWLTTEDDWAKSQRRPPFRMDAFYRHVRRARGLLMDERGEPLGGRFSFDADNRKPWRGEPAAPTPPRFVSDAITLEVGALIERRFARHPGTLDLEALPTTAADAGVLWRWALEACLPSFGPYEDAMSTATRTLFHTRISALLNLHRLLPREVIGDAVESAASLASREGFVRQILGWREYVRHVHRVTDGFRRLPDGAAPVDRTPGDGGFEGWRGGAWVSVAPSIEGGARPSVLGANRPVPPAYWGARSGLFCLDHVVEGVWAEGYGHHITRLMVLSNLATLLDLSPRAVTDWFWVAYDDAYDWVVEPNVLAMGTYGAGPLATTKPYVAGQAYIQRMSDYCDHCALAKTCPVTPLYWAFLERHREALAGNPRMRLPLASAAKRSAARRRHDARVAERVWERLERAEAVRPSDVEPE